MAVSKPFKKKSSSKGVFQPPQLKFKKVQKSPIRTHAYTARHQFTYGTLALKSLTPVFLGPKQLEIVRRFLMRHISRVTPKNSLSLLIRTKPTRPITRKGRGVRMGKGKGVVKYWVATELIGSYIVELNSCLFARAWLTHVSHKLASKLCVVSRKQNSILTYGTCQPTDKLTIISSISKHHQTKKNINLGTRSSRRNTINKITGPTYNFTNINYKITTKRGNYHFSKVFGFIA